MGHDAPRHFDQHEHADQNQGPGQAALVAGAVVMMAVTMTMVTAMAVIVALLARRLMGVCVIVAVTMVVPVVMAMIVAVAVRAHQDFPAWWTRGALKVAIMAFQQNPRIADPYFARVRFFMAQYERNPPLNDSDVLPDPLAQFERWLADAAGAGVVEPTAMALGTVSAAGRPSVRIVLFKGFHEGGFCFYTNYESRKGEELAAAPFAALTFWWDRLERQVRIEGSVQRVPRELSDHYFHSRPRGSQIGAYTSRQSKVLAQRQELDERLAATGQRFSEREIPLPTYWGGYRVIPESIEFWQGRANRAHDRLRYRRQGADWRIERLEP
jgi:pyridoxamine 5'-phosphate oxidase